MALTKITTSVVAVNSLTAANIADNSIDATKIANNQILARHIAADALSDQIADNSITAGMIPNATALTLDGGVTIDNITIDGTEIDLSSGDLTLDVAGDIILDVAGSDVIYKRSGTSVGEIQIGDDNFNIRSLVSDKDIIFKGNDAGTTVTAMTIDMSEAGRVGIGETSPLGKIHAKVSDTSASASAQGNLLVLEDTENGLSILSSTSGAGYINFGDSDDNDIGMIIYDHSANAMRFWANAAERMRINSSGRVMIGTTTEGRVGEGADMFTIGDDGSNNSGLTMRSGTSGYGSIYFSDATSGTGEYAGYLQYSHANERLHIATGSSIMLNVDSDGLKFNNDTAAANALDDYEEGTVSNNYIYTTGGGSGSLGTSGNLQTNKISYVKIGKMVHIHGQLGWSSGHGIAGANARFDLPFPVESGHRGALALGLVTDMNCTPSSDVMFTLVTEGAASVAYFLTCTDSGTHSHLSGADFTSNSYRTVSFAGSYKTTA